MRRAAEENEKSMKDEYYCICCFKKPKETKDEEHQKKTWQDSLIISLDNSPYLLFNFFVSTLCLFSSYYYGAHLCFRYSEHVQPHADDRIVYELIIECTFGLHMILQFFIEYKPLGEKFPIRNLTLISNNYLRGRFPLDLITILPLQFLELKRNRQHIFYLIKMLRIIRGFHLFDITNIMVFIKDYYKSRIMKMIENDPALGNDCNADNNCIELQLFISYTLKTLRLAIIILNVAYLTGVFWLFLAELINDFILDIDVTSFHAYISDEENPETFIGYYSLDDQSQAYNLIACMYFAFTSLSTVGFGDFNPRGNIERLTCAFILLFGVAIFSYIMGNFIEILDQFQKFNEDLDDGDNLNRFFGTLNNFNGQKPVDLQLKKTIEAHFDFRFQNDKLIAFRDDQDISMFDQLPEEVQETMYVDFLFKDFLYEFKRLFTFNNINCPHQPAFFSYSDYHYRGFMLNLLSCLEPRQEEEN